MPTPPSNWSMLQQPTNECAALWESAAGIHICACVPPGSVSSNPESAQCPPHNQLPGVGGSKPMVLGHGEPRPP